MLYFTLACLEEKAQGPQGKEELLAATHSTYQALTETGSGEELENAVA